MPSASTEVPPGVFTARKMADPYPDGIERHYWSLARARLVKSLIAREPAGGTILDVGCGRGVQVQLLGELGIRCLGVERSPEAPLPGTQMQVMTGVELEELPADLRATVSTALLLDVLEHLEDPSAFLRALRTALPSLRRLIVTVPARMELWSNYDTHYGHQCRYDLEGLQAAMRNGGFSTTAYGYAFRSLYLPARLLAAVGAKRGTTIRSPGVWTRWIHAGLAAAMSFEQRVLPRSVPGTSCWCIACPAPADGLRLNRHR